MALNECLENVRGLRPEEEIAELIKVTDVIKTSNPSDEWQSLGKLGEGGQAQVYKVKHRTNGMIAAMKRVQNIQPAEVHKVM